MPPFANAHFSNRNRRPIEANMIQGTTVKIEYANMKMTNQQMNETNVERRHAHKLLRANCSLAAVVDSDARYDPPRCAEKTRRNIMRKMDDWVRHDNPHGPPSSIFWLYGGAGAGKSALAQTMADKFKTSGGLAASFFFFKTDVNRNDGNSLISTLALQFLRSFPGIIPFVEQNIITNPDLFKKDRQTQMFELLVDPLKRLSLEMTDAAWQSNPESHPRLVVIDGLDECNNQDIQQDLLRIIGSVIPHLPYPLRFLITSRPESHITRVFQHDLRKVARYDLSNDSDADEDIRKFLQDEFFTIHRTHPLRRHIPPQWPPSGSINSIVERSSGHFIYASTVMRFIQSPRHRPDDRLQVILGLKQPYEKDRPFARLDSLYTLIFLEIQNPRQLERIQCSLGITHLRSQKRGLFGWQQWNSDRHTIETLLDLRPGDLILLFDPLLSLATFDKDDNIRIFHKSLFDYLFDSSRSGALALDLGLAHGAAANYILRRKKSGWDPGNLEDFAYHCQFARLNDTLRDYLRAVASAKSLSGFLLSPENPAPLQSILYFLQAMGRQNFSGDYYSKFVKNTDRCLRSAVPWSQKLKCLVSGLTLPRKSASIERSLRLALNAFRDRQDVQLWGNGFNGRTRIPAGSKNVITSIKQEHEMFSSYVKAHYRYPDIVISCWVASAGFCHSCHFVIRSVPGIGMCMAFLMLLTYTDDGVRLSCSKFGGLLPLHDQRGGRLVRGTLQGIMHLVAGHHQRALTDAKNDVTTIYPARLPRPRASQLSDP